ncbi:MAG: MMPL family transporter [Nitrospirota bacterium]|nr:MMPL family transporter [Nitrospirota bacterium]
MLKRLVQIYQEVLIKWVEVCRQRALWVVIVSLLLSGVSVVYTVKNITLDTNPLNLLDPNLPFRTLDKEFEAAFPQLADLIVIVVDQGSSEQTRGAVKELVKRLNPHPELFSSVYQPAQPEFFDQYGLLYFDQDELWRLDERLSKWQPFLGSLVHDPSLRGFFSMLTLALEEDPSPDQQALLAKVFGLLSDNIQAQRSGGINSSSWKNTMLDDVTDKGNETRGFLLVKPVFNFSELAAAGDPINFIRAQRDELQKTMGVRIRLTGSVPIETEERETIAKGAELAAGLSFGLVCLILLIGLRSARLVVAILSTLVIGLIWTAAFVVLAIGSINFISASAPVLFIGLGVDFGIQFGMRYREELDRQGNHAVALRQAISGVGGALTLAAIAAALSFFAFLPTSYRGFAELGLIAGTGMFIALFANVTVLPALLTVFPTSPVHRSDHDEKDGKQGILSSFLRYRRAILWTAAPLAVLAIGVLPLLRFDFNPLHLRDPSTEAVATFQELLADPDTSPYVIQIIAHNNSEAESIAAELEMLHEVDRVLMLQDFVPSDQDEKLAIIDDLALVISPILITQEPIPPPTSDEEVQAVENFRQILHEQSTRVWESGISESMQRLAQSLETLVSGATPADSAVEALRVRLIGDFPQWLDRLRGLMGADFVTVENLPQSLKDHYVSKKGKVRVEVFPVGNGGNNRELRQFVRSVQRVAPQAIGSPVGIVEGGQVVIDSCIQATGMAIIASAILLFVVFRRLGEMVLVLVPLLLTMVLTVSVCLLFGVPLNLANVIAVPLVLGLGIAFGIYLVLRKREGNTMVKVMRGSTSKAVFFSALTTMASFGSLSFSQHQGMASLGILLVISLTLALGCALLVLPAIMAELEQRGWWLDIKGST